MLFKTSIIAALASLTAVQGIVLPRVDGVYGATMNDDGTPGELKLIEAISERSANPASDVVEVLKRALPNPQIGCPGNTMDKSSGAYGTAYNLLNNWCDAGNVVPPGSVRVTYSGSAIAYICNYGGNNPCTSGEFREANILMDTACGAPKSGWVLLNDWAKGYGRDNKGVRICSWGYQT